MKPMLKELGMLLGALVMTSALTLAEEPITGTIKITNQKESDYPDLAQIPLLDAMETALAFVKGKVLKIELEDEDHFLVFTIEIVKSDHTIEEIVIDAGSGKVLLSEKDDVDSDDGKKDRDHDED